MKYGFIGCGNMGGAIAKALSQVTTDIAVADRSGKAKALASDLGITYSDNASIAANCDRIFLGVKPHMMQDMLAPLGLGLEDKLGVPVGNLSGGQRQTLALLMATMTPIDFLILDEHTAALDPKTAEIVMELTDKVVREKKLTTLMVTHNLRHAVTYGDRLLMMHQGGIVVDKSGEEKKQTRVEDLLDIFNEISVECGN